MLRNLVLSCATLLLLLGLGTAAQAVNCTVPAPTLVNFRENRPPFSGPVRNGQIIWHYAGRAECRDIYNVRFGIIGRDESQTEVKGIACPLLGCAFNASVQRDKPYAFKVQACHTALLQSSSCSQWGTSTYLPYGPDTCEDGFVWREAVAGDHVCVPPASRQQAQADNAAAGSRRNPQGGPYGPDTCLTGFVWREVNPGDHVCVTPPQRQQARDENAQGPGRRAS